VGWLHQSENIERNKMAQLGCLCAFSHVVAAHHQYTSESLPLMMQDGRVYTAPANAMIDHKPLQLASVCCHQILHQHGTKSRLPARTWAD